MPKAKAWRSRLKLTAAWMFRVPAIQKLWAALSDDDDSSAKFAGLAKMEGAPSLTAVFTSDMPSESGSAATSKKRKPPVVCARKLMGSNKMARKKSDEEAFIDSGGLRRRA